MTERDNHLFFNSENEFDKYLRSQNRSRATYGGISKSYDGYEWFVVGNLSCYIPIGTEEYTSKLPIEFKIIYIIILLCIIVGIVLGIVL